jgi:tetratricopeptide (TPR) repeat protein
MGERITRISRETLDKIIETLYNDCFAVEVLFFNQEDGKKYFQELASELEQLEASESRDFALGLILGQLENVEGAREKFEGILNYKPTSLKAQMGMILNLIDRYQYQKAFELSKEIRLNELADEMTDPAMFALWGTANIHTHNLPVAVEMFKKALEIKPDYHVAWNDLGVIYIYLKKYKEAEESFLKAIETLPRSTTTRCNFGAHLVYQKKLDAAKEHFLIALETNKDYALAHSWLSIIYRDKKKFDLAHEYLQKAIELRPDSPRFQDDLAELFVAEKKIEDAEAQFKRIIEKFPQYETAYNGLGKLYYNSKRYIEALDYFNQFVTITKNRVNIFGWIGAIYNNLGRFREAIQSYQKCILYEPGNPLMKEAWRSLESIHIKSKLFDSSDLDLYENLIENKNAYDFAYYYIGMILKNFKYYDDAIKSFKNAIDLMPDQRDSFSEIVKCYILMGKTADAKSFLEDMLHSHPNIYYIKDELRYLDKTNFNVHFTQKLAEFFPDLNGDQINELFKTKFEEEDEENQLTDLTLNLMDLETIPEFIFQYEQLTSLDLKSKNVKIIPKSITNLHNLTELHLSCGVLEEIPDYICDLNKLSKLYLSNNKLTTLPALNRLEHLKLLDIQGNEFIEIPSNLMELGGLRTLNVAKNKIKILPEYILNLKNLYDLDVSENNIDSFAYFLQNSESIKRLSLIDNPCLLELITNKSILEPIPDILLDFIETLQTKGCNVKLSKDNNLTEQFRFIRDDVFLCPLVNLNSGKQQMVMKHLDPKTGNVITIDSIDCIHTAICTIQVEDVIPENKTETDIAEIPQKKAFYIKSCEKVTEIKLSPVERFRAMRSWVAGIAEADMNAFQIQSDIEYTAKLMYPISNRLIKFMMSVDQEFIPKYLAQMEENCVFDGEIHGPSLIASLIPVIDIICEKYKITSKLSKESMEQIQISDDIMKILQLIFKMNPSILLFKEKESFESFLTLPIAQEYSEKNGYKTE